jgi:tight adherence protein C
MSPIDLNVPILLASLFFIVICLLAIGIMIHMRQIYHRRGLIGKIQSSDSTLPVEEANVKIIGLSGQSKSGFANFLSIIGIKVNPKKSANNSEVKLKFLRAGLRGESVPSIFWGSKFLFAVTLPVAFIILSVILFESYISKNIMMAAIFLSLLGLIIPDLWLHNKTASRRSKIIKGFPDALDLLVVCMEAGTGLDAALRRVGEEVKFAHRELSEEFQILNLELRAGKTRKAALRNLAERTDVDDVRSLVTVLIQTDRFGTSVAQALRVFSDSFRTARYQKAEEVAAKIATKLIFPLIFFILPSFFVVAVGPAVIQLLKFFITREP